LLNTELCPSESSNRLSWQCYCMAMGQRKNTWKEKEAWGCGWNRFLSTHGSNKNHTTTTFTMISNSITYLPALKTKPGF